MPNLPAGPDQPNRAALLEYRASLIRTEQEAQTAYDRTVLTLSAGGLGTSFAFLERFLGDRSITDPGWIKVAWLAWSTSLLAVLFSHYFSPLAMRYAVEQLDQGKIYDEQVGGRYGRIVGFLNAAGGLLFVAGTFAAVGFMVRNFR